MSSKFKPKEFQEVEIVDISSEGLGVAKVNEFVIFVEGTVPGDICDINVYKKKHSYGFANVIKLTKASEHRVKPPCQHFGYCGGCKWQHFDYKAQLFYKQKMVTEAFKRLAKVDVETTLDIIGCDEIYYYRNKLDFGFSDKKWLTPEQIATGDTFNNRDGCGFHIAGAFDKILNVEHCWLQDEPSNPIRNEVRRFALEKGYPFFNIRDKSGLMRTMIVRTSSTGEVMCIFSFYNDDTEKINELLTHVQQSFPQITSLLYVINQKGNDTIFDLPVHCFYGKEFMYEEMEGLKFKVGPKSFYQTNSKQAYNLYKITRQLAQLTGNETVYDLYTGTGTIAQFIAKNAKKVIGVEFVPEAIEDAKVNAQLNKIDNASFFAGDMKEVLNDAFISTHGKPDVIITDPPRAGMHVDVVNKILQIAPQRIVYVSCNPASQARDVAILSEKYKVVKLQAVDMFPQTLHVESVALLELK